ncbi:interleukin 12 receptor, beta 2a, like isoform X3 [Eleginops maclovinus]|uniref:interleukin 12 receptor, beta 2a, like isoform X3 n=1 Tax=Eleginops maclovinus TaxID=56733 RepID=UPI0030803C9A
MATLWTRWLLSILLATLPSCFAQDPPAAPSPPECCTPCGEKNNCVDIHCSNPGLDPQIQYSLHWEQANSEEGHLINRFAPGWIIPRENFSHGELLVWIQAKNEYGSAESKKVMLKTANILKLPPPEVASNQEAFEIFWNFTCDEHQRSYCDVRYRTKTEQVWIEDKDVSGGYTIEIPQPCTVYELQVRCSCGIGLKSDWSASHRLRSTETGKEKAFHVEMNAENLTVSWDSSSQLSDNLKEYVVQYKQIGSPPGQGFDWVKSQRTAFFKGHYKKYTPYRVSLFTLSHGSEVHHISSVTRYSIEGSPSAVPAFNVFSIAANQVTLSWESGPLSEQKGVILYYQIIVDSGVQGQYVYNVSASQKHKYTFKLEHLTPEQDYEVRIRAVTVAGPGENATSKFKTNSHEDLAHRISTIMIGVSVVVVICVVIALYSIFVRERNVCLPSFYYKVPDARNSNIFKNNHLINDSLSWICIALCEPHPKISLLEVVEIQSRVFKSSLEKASDPEGLTRPVIGDECSQMDSQDDKREEAVPEECHRTDHRYGREEYSKMVDSEEERDKEEKKGEDCWSSSEEDNSTSGYEKHFMPTTFELLTV